MRIILLLMLSLLIPLLSAPAQAKDAEAPPAPLRPYEDPASGLWGYKSGDGAAIAPRFVLAGDFVMPEGAIAPVVDEQGWAWIDRSGQVLLRPFVFDNGPDDFSEGLSRYVETSQDGERYGFIDRKGRIAIQARFDFALPFSEGRAAFCQGCSRVHHGEHWSMEGGDWGCIDRQGQVLATSARDADTACGK